MEALPFVAALVLGLIFLVTYKRLTALLLASEARYGGKKAQARARTEARRKYARRFVVVWCLLFIGSAGGGIIQNT